MGYDYDMCVFRRQSMAYARQKLLLQKQQTEDEERRGISMQQRAAVPQRTSFSSSYQSQFINHTQNASVEVINHCSSHCFP